MHKDPCVSRTYEIYYVPRDQVWIYGGFEKTLGQYFQKYFQVCLNINFNITDAYDVVYGFNSSTITMVTRP